MKHVIYKKKIKKLSDYDAVQLALKCKTLSKFFGIKAFLLFTVGIGIAATISIVFFFATGGTIAGLIENIPNLLATGSNNMFSEPLYALASKLKTSIEHFNAISFGVPYILPVFYFGLLIDRKRQRNNHRLIYVCLALTLSVFYTVGIVVGALSNSRRFAIALPFFILASVCYILTEKKNKKLFYCMWLPSAIATIVQHLASDMHLSVFWVLIIANIAGVFFVQDFIKELTPIGEKESKIIHKVCLSVVSIGICLQLVFQCGLYMVGRTVKSDYAKLEKGSYAGLRLEEQNLQRNNSIMDDLDIIKQRSDADDPVWILSEFSWMYLYIERPFATYSAWQPNLKIDMSDTYFTVNPDKMPKYIYVCWVYIPTSVTAGHQISPERAQRSVETILEKFDCDVEELSNGFLLSVK